MSVQALFFDLDDTLIDSERAYSRALESVGLRADDAEYVAARDAVKSILPAGHVSSSSRVLYFKWLVESRGRLHASRLLEIIDRYETVMLEDMREQWKTLGREAHLRRLQAKYRLALLTNENTRTQLRKLSVIDPNGDLFDFMVTSEDLGVAKPDARVFEEGLRRAGLKAGQVVMIGNSCPIDLEMPQRLGMSTIWTREFLPHAGERGPSVARIVERLEEITAEFLERR